MKKIRAAIVGFGNIGKYVLEALQAAEDFEIAGIIRRDAANVPEELKNYTVATEIESLGKVDVAILCTPSRSVQSFALKLLEKGINTVDSFDIHTQITSLRRSARRPRSTAPFRSCRPAGTRAATRWCALCSKPAPRKGLLTRTSAPA